MTSPQPRPVPGNSAGGVKFSAPRPEFRSGNDLGEGPLSRRLWGDHKAYYLTNLACKMSNSKLCGVLFQEDGVDLVPRRGQGTIYPIILCI